MDDATAQKLADLDSTFNTNPGFGLMGMLGQQEQQHQQPQQVQTQADPEPDSKPPEWFDLLNQTIQTKSKRDEELLSTLTNKIGTIESRIQQPSAQPQQFQQEPGEELDSAALERRQLFANQAALVIDNSYERGRNAIARLRSQNPNTDISEADLKAAFELNGLQQNPDLARRMDWEAYFDAEDKKRQAPKLASRLKELEQELTLLKSGKGIENMASVPRSNRAVTPSNASSDNGIDEEVYRAASARMGKGRFSGFGRALFEEQQKKQRRVAV